MIVFDKVTKVFDSRTVLSDLTFTVGPGEFVCLTGPSGAGKSTVVHLLIRAENATSGTVSIDGVELKHLRPSILQMYRRRTGVLFQDYKLLEDRTVSENIAFAMEVCGDDDATIAARVAELITKLKLTGRENAFPRELSGGEKTRAALARAMVHHPKILLADEPTGNIDPIQSLEILSLLKEINAEGCTVVLATHDQTVVDALHTRVLRLENGKLVRDSVGGYGATGVVRSEPALKKHEALKRVSKANKPGQFTHIDESEKNPEDTGSGKIKPIAI